MRHKLHFHLTYANVTATLALFVALGGTTLAASGGNFILGQSNSASSTTALSAGTTGPALKATNTSTGTAASFNVAAGHPPFSVNSGAKVANLNADKIDGKDSSAFLSSVPPVSLVGPGGEDVFTVTNTGNGRGLAGLSDSWQGVYGHSNTNAGVVGESQSFDGVYGVSNSSSGAGVSGHNDFGGWGVWASGGDSANNTAAIHGQSSAGNAVEGISGKNTASGVYGQNDSTGFGVAGRSTNGTGVLGDSSNGWAVNSSGNATQTRTGNGFVKAMAFVDPLNTPSDPIRRCFNSQLPPSQATTRPCGITYTRLAAGGYILGFGVRVDDRFASVTTVSIGFAPTLRRIMSVQPGTSNTDLRVVAYDPKTDTTEETPFYIFVY